MALLTSAVQIVNQALRHLGDESVLGLDDTTRRAQFVEEFYPTARDRVLWEHPWNFAMKRATLLAYSAPPQSLSLSSASGTGVVVTATGAAFATTDLGKTIRQTAGGIGEITQVNSASEVLIDVTSTFTTTSVASGAWKLYNPTPEFGFDYSLTLPSDWLRGWRLGRDDSEEHWQHEGDYLVAKVDTLQMRYIARIEDVSKFPAPFIRALVAYLTATIAEGITGQGSKSQYWTQVYQLELRSARTRDGQEGTAERVRSDSLINVRFGGV